MKKQERSLPAFRWFCRLVQSPISVRRSSDQTWWRTWTERPAWKTQLSPARKEFFIDLMLTRLIRHSVVGSRELWIMSEGAKEDVHEPASKLVEHEAHEPRYCNRDRQQLSAGFAVLHSDPP
jgi:hypothetical protein